MSTTPKVLVEQQYVENATTSKYTSPANGKGTWIDKATFANTDVVSQTITVYIVPSGGSAGNDTKAIPATAILTGAVTSIADLAGKFISPGASIQWVASAASKVNGAINGREVA